jgi:hypothetical protein
VHSQDQLVNGALPFVEAGAYRKARAEVAGIARGRLGARVEEEEAARLEPSIVRVGVERGALGGGDHREGEAAARGEGHFRDAAVDVGLEHARPGRSEGGLVHVDRNRDRPVHLRDLRLDP